MSQVCVWEDWCSSVFACVRYLSAVALRYSDSSERVNHWEYEGYTVNHIAFF